MLTYFSSNVSYSRSPYPESETDPENAKCGATGLDSSRMTNQDFEFGDNFLAYMQLYNKFT